MKKTDIFNYNRPTILVYEDGMPSSERRAIMSAFDKMTEVEVVSISRRVLDLGLHPNKFCEISSDQGNDDRIAAKYNNEYPEIFFNKYMQFQFERVENEINSAVSYGDVFSIYLDILNPSLVLFGHEAFTIERVLVGLAKGRKIATAGLLHGCLGLKFFFRGVIGEADKILVWNDIDIEWLLRFGADRSKLHKIGCVRYESMYLKYLNDQTVTLIETKKNAKKRLGIRTDKPLIVVTTAEINTGFAAPVADANSHIKTLIEFLSFVESRQDLDFIIKAHPSFDYYELYKRMLGTDRPNLKFLQHAVLSEVLAASDICLMINYCTTAALEAMLQKIPVIYLNNAVYPLSDWSDNLSELGICRVKSMKELEINIDLLLNNYDHRQYQLAKADKQIIETLGWEERSPSDRFIDFLTNTLNESKKDKGSASYSNKESSGFSIKKLLEYFNNKVNSTDLRYDKLSILSFLAGVQGLGISFLKQVYANQVIEMNFVQSINKEEVRKKLVLAFIKGSLSRGGFNHFTFANLTILIPLITLPGILFQISFEERVEFFKFILCSIFGRYYLNIISINPLRKGWYALFK